MNFKIEDRVRLGNFAFGAGLVFFGGFLVASSRIMFGEGYVAFGVFVILGAGILSHRGGSHLYRMLK